MSDMHTRSIKIETYTTRRGFSLVEILVAMVILTIGILALARVFPGGLLSIQRTGELTVAQSLAKQQLADLENGGALPQGILAAGLNTSGQFVFFSDVTSDNISDLSAATLPAGIPAGVDPYFYSNINKIRYIKGEPVSLPVGTPNGSTSGYGAIYMLQFGPVFNAFSTDGSGNPTDLLRVYGAALQRTLQSSAPTVDNPNPTPQVASDTQYVIDYANRQIAFAPRLQRVGRPNFRLFLIQYDYFTTVSGNVVVRTVTGQIRVPDIDPVTVPVGETAQPVWQPIFAGERDPNGITNPNGTPKPADFDDVLGFRKETEEINRSFRLMNSSPVQTSGVAPAWSDDPYEYAWYSNQQRNNGNGGVLLFNPLGRTNTFQTPFGNKPITALVDYMTFDNHIIREDRYVPGQGPYELKLSLQNILTQGELQEDQTPYDGMFRDPNGVATPAIIIYNKSTGEEIDSFTGTCTNGIGTGRNFVLDTRKGVIRLTDDFVRGRGLQNINLRIYYRAAKQWGTQIQKAYAKYARVDTTASVDYKSFFVGSSGVGTPTRIYFSPSEAGKSVVLGEYTVSTSTGQKRFSNETYQIQSDRSQFEMGLPYLDLRDMHPEAQAENWQFDNANTGASVRNVTGASIKSRAMWVDSTTLGRDSAGNATVQYRWRRLDTDTMLNALSR
jgi:prepilin-type N-terminal cleavage/methylation domain-containing protein